MTATNSTTIKALWQLSPADSRRGIIKGFKLFYKKKDIVGLPTEVTMNGSEIRFHYATGLDENTEYEFQVLTSSSAGDGPKSAFKVQRTTAYGKNTCFVSYCSAVFNLVKQMVVYFLLFYLIDV